MSLKTFNWKLKLIKSISTIPFIELNFIFVMHHYKHQEDSLVFASLFSGKVLIKISVGLAINFHDEFL